MVSETEVNTKVPLLFTDHEDLLAEISLFLPDSTQQRTVTTFANTRRRFNVLFFRNDGISFRIFFHHQAVPFRGRIRLGPIRSRPTPAV